MINNKVLIAMGLIMFSQINISYAGDNEIGLTHIKKIQETSVQEDQSNVGNLSILENVNISKMLNKKNIPSDEALKILSRLNNIVSCQDKGNYMEALLEMKELSNDYPESSLFKKWEAIYLNKTNQYQDSLDTFIKIKKMFPLDDQIQNGLEYDIYMIDNYRNLKDYDNAKKILNTAKNKLNTITLSNQDETVEINSFKKILKKEKLINTLLIYQEFMIDYNINNDIDEKKLIDIWNDIPEEKIYALNSFYGFDLDDLGLLYGKTFNRKDILKKYVEHKEKSIDQETIKKVQLAKQIIFKKY